MKNRRVKAVRCEAIRPVIRPFLDDLLDEKEYQEIQTHLSGCVRCHAYASSVGTLSYRLHELGQVSLPPDMISTILYELKKQHGAERADVRPSAAEAFTSRTRLFWISAFVVFGVSLGATVAVMNLWRMPKEKAEHGARSTEKTIGAVPSVVSLPLSAPQAISPPPPAERHYHVSRSSRSELVDLAREFQCAVERESDVSFVFDVPRPRLAEFGRRLEALSGVVKEYGEPEPPEAASDPVRMSVFFE